MAAQAQPLLTALPEHFAASRQSCYLYAASELVKTFGSNLAYEQALGGMLSRMLGEACAGLRTLAQFNEDPELADDTFLLVGRMLAYSPRLVLAPGPLGTLLDTALAGVLVQHRDACGSVMTFLVRLLEMELPGSGGSGDRAVYTVLLPRAPAMVRLLLAGAAGALPPARNPQIAGVLFALIKVTQQQGLQWASQAVAAVPETALSASDRQKLLGVMQVTAIEGPEARNYGEFEDVIEDLSDSCRRHRRFQDAAQQALLPPPVHA
jgi:transportin-3